MTTTTEIAASLHSGLRAGGASFAVYLPDSVLSGVTRLLENDPAVTTVVCSREDEGVAIATGAALAGELPVVLMEGSGMGYCGLILARARSQRTPLLLIFSHVEAFGDGFDFHASSRVVGEATCRGLGIPYEVLRDATRAADLVEQALVTVRGQRAIVGIAVPGHLRS